MKSFSTICFTIIVTDWKQFSHFRFEKCVVAKSRLLFICFAWSVVLWYMVIVWLLVSISPLLFSRTVCGAVIRVKMVDLWQIRALRLVTFLLASRSILGQGVKNAAPRCCSAADEWSYLSCHEGSAGEVTAQLYLVSGADACTPLPFTREETEKQKRGRERETNPAPSSTSSVPPEPISLPIIPQSCCPERRLWHIYMFFLLTFQRPFCQRL